jgi:hypothetical protein
LKRIHALMDNEIARIDFVDYKDGKQLKDFYKLFKKASGYAVLEYREEEGRILAVTSNAGSSVQIAWNAPSGCCAFSQKKDCLELVRIAYRMLCYRYRDYGDYSSVLSGVVATDEPGESSGKKAEKAEAALLDEDILRDLDDLISLTK